MKYSEEMTHEIATYLKGGNNRTDTCTLAGISYETFTVWMEKPEFSETIKRAEAVCKGRMIGIVHKAAEVSWQAAAWWLERKHWNEFALKNQNVEERDVPVRMAERAAELLKKLEGGKPKDAVPVSNGNGFHPEELEQAVNLAWKQGRLDYLRRNTQKALKQFWLETKKYSRKCYWECTRRLGKSTELLMTLHEECKSANRRKCVFFAPVKEGLLDYIEPIIEETYADCPTHLRPIFDRHRFLLRYDNGSRILFRAANNKQYRVRRGLGAHLAVIDEAREIDNLMELIDSVIMPALFSNNGYLIVSSTPADTRSHPLYSLRSRAKLENWHKEITIWDAHEYDSDTYSLERINEWKAETIKDLDGQSRWEREYECKWVVNKRRMAVPEWNSKTMVQVFGTDPYNQFYHRYMGLDWGYKDYTAIVFATLNFRKARLEINSELTFSGQDVRSDIISDRINQNTKHIYGKQIDHYRQVSDSADPILINEINKYPNMNFMPVEKAHTLEAMLNEFRVLVSLGKIVVDPKCQLTIHCLENAVWTEKRDKLDQDVIAHHFDHLMAVVYLTRMIDWEVNPIPKDFMVDNVRVIELNWDKTKASGTSAKSLETAFGRKK